MKSTLRLKRGVVHQPASKKTPKRINLAIQGGGSHCAFAWGVVDKFLEDGRVEIEGLSGTSAGSMNAVVYAYGKIRGNDGAREALHNFWRAISEAGEKFNPVRRMPWERFSLGWNLDRSFAAEAFKLLTNALSRIS